MSYGLPTCGLRIDLAIFKVSTWWPGVLEHAQYSISRTYNLLQRKWVQKGGLGSMSRQDALVKGSPLTPQVLALLHLKSWLICLLPLRWLWLEVVKMALDVLPTSPTQDAGRKWRSDLRYRRQQVSGWWLTGIPGTDICYVLKLLLQKALSKKEVKPKRAKARPLGHLGPYLQNQRSSELLPGLNFLPRHPFQTIQIPGHPETQISSLSLLPGRTRSIRWNSRRKLEIMQHIDIHIDI